MLETIFEINIIYCRYDAVTDEGDLDWQNCLNEKNRSFFAVSDGLFTNYTWSVSLCIKWNCSHYRRNLPCSGGTLYLKF